MSEQLKAWTGTFGKAYLERNADTSETDLAPRIAALAPVLATCPSPPRSILEVGANIGRNLAAFARLSEAELYAVEPFKDAFDRMTAWIGSRLSGVHNCAGQSLPFDDNAIDFVFTSGVLIHVPPAELETMMREIVRVAGRYVWCNEYFAKSPEEVEYRGHSAMLFKRDFGRYYLDLFPELTAIGTGFLWSVNTPFDDTVWWLFEKRGR